MTHSTQPYLKATETTKMWSKMKPNCLEGFALLLKVCVHARL